MIPIPPSRASAIASARLGDRVHRRGDDRDLERDRRRQPRRRGDVVREHRRLGRNEQHIVEGEAFLAELAVSIELELQESVDSTKLVGRRSDPPATSYATGSQLVDLDERHEARGLLRVEAAGADLEHRCRACRHREPQGLLGRTLLGQRREPAREQDVAGADDRDGLELRRLGPVAPHLALLPDER